MGRRRAAAVLFADIRGFSRMMGQDEAGMLVRVRRVHDTARTVVQAEGGRVVKTIGDGLMCELPDAVHAVRAGLALALAVDEAEAARPDGDRVRVRVGVHTGEVLEEDDGDLFGETVNVAARLEPLAEPGGLAVSGPVLRAARGEVPMRCTDCGMRRLKNIADSVRVWRVSPPGAARDPARLARAVPPALALASLLVLAALAGWALLRPHRDAPAPARRLVVLATTEAASDTASSGPAADAGVAWTLASRVVEEIDHYAEFRPISPAGVLSARMEVLGSSDALPDEVQAGAIADRLGADTIASLSVAAASPSSSLTVSVHVYDVRDPAQGVSLPRSQFSAEDLDGTGPGVLADRIAKALPRQWSLGSLTDESESSGTAVPFDAYRTFLTAMEYCTLGRYDRCEEAARKALLQYPDYPHFHCTLACALSFQGKAEEAEAAVGVCESKLTGTFGRRDRLLVEADVLWMEAERAKRSGDDATVREVAGRLLPLYRTLSDDYEEPIGSIYAAAGTQYFLGDPDGARALYAEARRKYPSLYPSYQEEARLLVGDGTNAAGKREAAALLFRYIACYPTSPTLDIAIEDAITWGLEQPAQAPDCTTKG